MAENTQWNGRNVLDGSVDVTPAEVNHGAIATSAVNTTTNKITLNVTVLLTAKR